MANIKSRETLLSELKTFIKAYNRSIDTNDNSILKDLILLPYAIGGKAIMDQVAVARDLAILSKNSGDDLDSFATNYNLERSTGSYASATLTFFSTSQPTADIVIPSGQQASTSGTSFVSPVIFATIAEARFSVTDIASYYNYDRDRYEFEVNALAINTGSEGNVGSNLINQMVGSITGINGVTNLTASFGGLDQEEDDDLRVRIQTIMTGRDLNTTNGLRTYTQGLGFTDAYPVRPESTDAEKATGIDVFVINNSSQAATDIFNYNPTQTRYYLTNRPALQVTAVVGSNKGTLTSSDYSANIDNTSPYRRSIYGQDYITLSSGAGLLIGEQITVSYNYSPLIVNTQNTFNNINNEVLTADPLLKRAYPLYFYIVAILTLKANADGPTTRNKVRNALSQYLTIYRLGDDIQKSDIVLVLQQGYGDYPVEMVDAVVITSYYLQDEFGTQRQPVNETISVGNKEYVVFGSATLT